MTENYTTRKEQCKALMLEIFGPACEALVDDMSEEECVEKCKTKVMQLLGERMAARFDAITTENNN